MVFPLSVDNSTQFFSFALITHCIHHQILLILLSVFTHKSTTSQHSALTTKFETLPSMKYREVKSAGSGVTHHVGLILVLSLSKSMTIYTLYLVCASVCVEWGQ